PSQSRRSSTGSCARIADVPALASAGPSPASIYRMRNPSASTKPSWNPDAIAAALYSDVADVRQHLLSEQFERFHQLVGMFRARGLERQIDDAAADLSYGYRKSHPGWRSCRDGLLSSPG